MKPKYARRLLYLIAFLAVACGAFELQALFWTRDYARARALRRVSEVCILAGRDPKLLTGPHEDTVANRPWSFEWVYQGQPRYLYGIWFTRSGSSELYGGDPDDPSSAAYESH